MHRSAHGAHMASEAVSQGVAAYSSTPQEVQSAQVLSLTPSQALERNCPAGHAAALQGAHTVSWASKQGSEMNEPVPHSAHG